MEPNPFRCPKCRLPANDVDGDPFQMGEDDCLAALTETTLLVHCDGGHGWFESATFSRPVVNWDTLDITPPQVLTRRTVAID